MRTPPKVQHRPQVSILQRLSSLKFFGLAAGLPADHRIDVSFVGGGNMAWGVVAGLVTRTGIYKHRDNETILANQERFAKVLERALLDAGREYQTKARKNETLRNIEQN